MKLRITHDDVLQAIANHVSGQPPLADDIKVEPKDIKVLVKLDNHMGPGYSLEGAEIDLEF